MSFCWIRWERLVWGYVFIFVINLVNITVIEIADPIEIHITGVIAKNRRNFFGWFENSTFKIFLSFLFHISYIIVSINFILIIIKFNFPTNLIIQSPNHHVLKSINWMIALNCLTIFKLYFFESLFTNSNRSHTKLNFYPCPTGESVPIVRSINKNMCNWRMMGGLFCVDLGPIGASGLVRLAQNGVQRFLELVAAQHEGHGCCHKYFKPFNWVIRDGCSIIQIKWIDGMNLRKSLQNRLCAHTFDWKAYRCQIKMAHE